MMNINELREKVRNVRTMEDFMEISKEIYFEKEEYGIKKKDDIYLLFIFLLNDRIDKLERMI